MGPFNRISTGLFDLIFLPFRSLHPLWALAVVSLVAGVMMLWVFGKVSDQAAIRLVRDRIRGNLIGIRLFGDDLGMLFRLQARILRQTLTYMRLALVPMLILFLPVLVFLIQLNLRYALRPLEPGETTVLTVSLRDKSPLELLVTLDVPGGVVVETPAVRAVSAREVSWRLRVAEPGRHLLTLRAGGETLEKELLAGGGWQAVSRLRSGAVLDLLLYPGEPPIPRSSEFASVRLLYAPLPLDCLGFRLDWLLFFFIASIAFGFLFKGALGVEV